MRHIKKILVTILGPYICFYYKNDSTYKDLLNTNIISDSEVVFSEEYIQKNKTIVSSFLDELILKNKITKAKFKDQSIAIIILDVLAKNKNIKQLYIEDNSPLTYDLFVKVKNAKAIKYVNCYTIPKFILEQFDKNKIKVESRDEVFFTSHFMEYNSLINYSKMYYKKSIFINTALCKEDEIDLKTFIQINKYLKEIHISYFDKNTINKIVTILHGFEHKNIKIYIHENVTDVKLINYLKKANKMYSKKYKVELKLVYSDEYISNNLFAQLIVNNIKMCSFIIILIFVAFFGVVLFNNYKDRKSVNDITAELTKIVEETQNNDSNVNKVDENITTNDAKKVNDLFNELLDVNKDTVGWLKVNETTIDYPVVQTDNNDYYLNNDYYRNKNYNGWIFADYRNNLDDLDENTIIYGHNKYLNQTMFGTLNNVLSDEWLANPDNQFITFNNLYKEMRWQIFSVYKINNTNDYLTTSFASKAAYKKFLRIIKTRSVKDFNVEVTTSDKVLTLSTCIDQNKRLVVHAVLIN